MSGRALVIVGPVGLETPNYKFYADSISYSAAKNGMGVTKLYSPDAKWGAVKAAAQGVNLLVYLGHGNGWPSPYLPFQEKTKDGFGLNPRDSTNDVDVSYRGGDQIRESIVLAPNAVVFFNHLCYAAGNGEPGQALPTESTALQRVDNFASAFLTVGASAVFALSIQPEGPVVNSLFKTDSTMDAIFKMKFGTGTCLPCHGFVGWKDTYYDSVRNAGNRIHLDPDATLGYGRSVTGNLDFTSTNWRAGLV